MAISAEVAVSIQMAVGWGLAISSKIVGERYEY